MRIAVTLILLLCLGGAAAWWWYAEEIRRRADLPLDLAQPQVLNVPEGAHLADILDELDTRGLSGDGWWLRRYAVGAGIDKRLQTGEFRILPGDSARRLLERIVAGDVIRYRFTIIEGWTVSQLLGELAQCSLQVTVGLAPGNLAQRLAIPHDNPEGWFLPDTYDYVRSDSDLALLARAHAAMRSELEHQWTSRPEALPYADPYEALIVASLIEKESGVSSERPLIASVFVHRLRLGMRLQTDPSVIYGLGSAFDGNLTKQHLTTPTPYNTYTIAALPPTPIALPGRASLEAALDPADTKHLYFVGRGDGTSQFSDTLEQHNKAVNRYQRRLPGGGR